jgi:hypothetical protein
MPSYEITKLEREVREAEARLARARTESEPSPYFWSRPNPVAQALRNREPPSLSSAADARWEQMLQQAEAMIAQGRPVTGEFIVAAAARARAGQEPAKHGTVVPLRPALPPTPLDATTTANFIIEAGRKRRGETT